MTPRVIALFLTAALVSCSGNGSSPSAPSAPANRAPVINSATVNPTWGIAGLTVHTFTSTATDPDGDPLSYSWNFGNGSTAAGSGSAVTFSNTTTTTYQATLTVTDSRGLSVNATVPVTSLTVTGNWTGTMSSPVGPTLLTVSLTQSVGGFVTGTWAQPAAGGVGEVGPAGEPGTIRADGTFDFRFKVRVGNFTDFFYRGSINPTGQQLTGTLTGSGFTGDVLVLNKTN